MVTGPVTTYGPFASVRMAARSGIFAVVSALVSLAGRCGKPEEDELRDARTALQAITARIEHGKQTFATARISGIPHRAVDRDSRPKKARAWPRESHEIGRQVHLLAIRNDVRAAMKIPPTALIGRHVLARCGLAHVIGRPEEPRRREALHAFDAQVDPVGLKLQLDIEVLDERRCAREGRAKLLSGEHRHFEQMLAG